MKYAIIILLSCILFGCKTSNEISKSQVIISDDPLITVIKFNSLLESCIKDSTVFQFADVGKMFSYKKNMDELEIWCEFVDQYCLITSLSKSPNTTKVLKSYYSYDFQTIYSGNKAKVLLYHDIDLVEVYTLTINESTGKWIIVDMHISRLE
ncbi:MAG: hypothetical protein RIR55_1516 [Bacteroidota bacterium]